MAMNTAREISLLGLRIVPGAAHAQAGHSGIIAQDFIHNVIPEDLDLAFFFALEELALQDLLGT